MKRLENEAVDLEGLFDRAEARFDRGRRTAGLFLGPVMLGLVWILPIPALTPDAHRLAAIVTFTAVWWITEAVPLPVTAMLAAALIVVLGVATPQEAFAEFANPIMFVFIGAFIIARAISGHGLDLRLARSVLAIPAIGASPARSRAMLGIATTLISGWMNNTATAAMMTPVGIGILGGPRGARASRRFGTGLLLIIACAATIGGMLTPVASAMNLITIGLLDRMGGVRVNFFAWMLLCVPIAMTMLAIMLVVTGWLFPSEGGQTLEGHAQLAGPGPLAEAAPWTPGQRNCLIVFLIAVTLWVTPGLLGLMAPEAAFTRSVGARLDVGVVAVFAASLLFVLPTNWTERRFTLSWREAAEIDWGTILMFGGGLALGHFMDKTGLAEAIGRSLVNVSGAESLWAITAIAAAIAILLTELVSNTACVTMLVPVVIAICQATGLNPVAPAVATCLGSSLSFMLPISTPPNAIAYSTGLVPIGSMIRLGVVLDVLGFFTIVVGLRLLAPLLGYAEPLASSL